MLTYSYIKVPIAPDIDDFDFYTSAEWIRTGKAKRPLLLYRLMKENCVGHFESKMSVRMRSTAVGQNLYSEMVKWCKLFDKLFEIYEEVHGEKIKYKGILHQDLIFRLNSDKSMRVKKKYK